MPNFRSAPAPGAITNEPGSITNVYRQLAAGDPQAVEVLWSRFFPRLSGLARQTLGKITRPVVDVDDVLQSAFFGFWRQAQQGDYAANVNRHDLWNLLATITVRKVRSAQRREHAQKRGGGRVESQSEAADVAQLPAAEFDSHSAEFLSALDDEPRAIALLRLMGYKNREIADLLDCTERKVERKLQMIREVWEELDSPDDKLVVSCNG